MNPAILEAEVCIDLGWKVLALRPGRKDPDAALVPHGVYDATDSLDVLRGWARFSPLMNFGITCEAFDVFDTDTKHDGPAALARFESQHGYLPGSVRARTGSGGEHILFKPWRGRLRGKIAQGIDIKSGAGAYIVGSDSVHPSGGSYTWTRHPLTHKLVDAPAWLVALAMVPATEPAPIVPVSGHSDRVERARRYLDRCPIAISGADGQRTTFIVAQKIVRGFALDTATAYALLSEWNQRCDPPWSRSDLCRKITEAATRGTMPVGALLERGTR